MRPPDYTHLSDETRAVQIAEGQTNIDLDSIPLADATGERPEAAYLEYEIRFDPDFEFASGGSPGGMKLPGFVNTTTGAGTGGTAADGVSWSTRPSIIRPGHPKCRDYAGDAAIKWLTQAYHLDADGEWGEDIVWDLGCEPGEWVTVGQFVALNDPDAADGILRTSIDGDVARERTDLRLRDSDESRIDRVWYGFYFGGVWSSPRDQTVEIRDLRLWSGDPAADEPTDPPMTDTHPDRESIERETASDIVETIRDRYDLDATRDPFTEIDLGTDDSDRDDLAHTAGVRITPHINPDRLSARLSDRTDGVTRAILRAHTDPDDGEADPIETVALEDGWAHFEADLEAGESYDVVADAQGDAYQRGRGDDYLETPLEADVLDVTAGIYGTDGAFGPHRYVWDRLIVEDRSGRDGGGEPAPPEPSDPEPDPPEDPGDGGGDDPPETPDYDQLDVAIEDTVQSESWLDNTSGVRVEALEDIEGLTARISDGTRPYESGGVLNAAVRRHTDPDDGPGEVLARKEDIDTQTVYFDVALEGGEVYEVVVDAGGERLDRGRASVEYPIENEWLRVTGGVYGDDGATSESYWYVVEALLPGDGDVVKPVPPSDKPDREYLGLAGDDPKEQRIGAGRAETANGIHVAINEDVPGLACRLSSECDEITRAYLMSADRQRELYSTTVDPYGSAGEVVEFPVALEAGDEVRIMFDAGDDREYSRGVADDVLPIEGDALSVTQGYYSWALDSTSSNRYNVSEIAPLESSPGIPEECSVSVPDDLEVIDIDEHGGINEERDLVPQILSIIEPDGAYRFVGDGAYRWDGQFGFTDSMPYFELRGSPKMTLEVNSDDVGQGFSFGSWGDNNPPENVVLQNVDVDISGSASRDCGLIYAMVGQCYLRNVGLVGARDRHGDHGNGGDRYTWLICTRDPDGVSVIEDCALPDGEHLGDSGSSVGYSIGFNSDPPHRGLNLWRRCYIEDYIDNGFYLPSGKDSGRNVTEDCVSVNCGNGMMRIGHDDEAISPRLIMDRGLGRTHPGCGLWFQGGVSRAEDVVILAPAPGNDLARFNSDCDGGEVDGLLIQAGPEAPSPSIRCTSTSDTDESGVTVRDFRVEDESGVTRSSGGSSIGACRISRSDIRLEDGEIAASQREPFYGPYDPELENVDY